MDLENHLEALNELEDYDDTTKFQTWQSVKDHYTDILTKYEIPWREGQRSRSGPSLYDEHIAQGRKAIQDWFSDCVSRENGHQPDKHGLSNPEATRKRKAERPAEKPIDGEEPGRRPIDPEGCSVSLEEVESDLQHHPTVLADLKDIDSEKGSSVKRLKESH